MSRELVRSLSGEEGVYSLSGEETEMERTLRTTLSRMVLSLSRSFVDPDQKVLFFYRFCYYHLHSIAGCNS